MFTFTSEFFLGALIGFVLGLLLCNCRPNINNMEALIQTMKLLPITKLSATNKIYSPEIEKLWNDLKRLYDERIKLDPKFSFYQMATEICELREGKGIAATPLKDSYKQTLEAIEEWIDKNKEIDVNSNEV